MSKSNIFEQKLPSNKSFGFLFGSIFLIIAIYFIFQKNNYFSLISLLLSFSFLILSIFKPTLLLPLNRLWMRFGFLLSLIVNPIVLGLIFFVLITPIGIISRLFGRDELKLKLKENNSYWVVTNSNNNIKKSFKQQF